MPAIPGCGVTAVSSTVLATLCLFTSCASHVRWDDTTAGRRGGTSLTAQTGWGFNEYEAEIDGKTGAIAGAFDQDSADLATRAGGLVRLDHNLTDCLRIGGFIGYRITAPDTATLLGVELPADYLHTLHLGAKVRYVFEPLKSMPRVRPTLGLELTLLPNVDLDGQAVYGPGLEEDISFRGDAQWIGGASAGFSVLMDESSSLELGLLYEWTLDPTEDDVTLNVPDGMGGTVASIGSVSLETESFIPFIGFTWHF